MIDFARTQWARLQEAWPGMDPGQKVATCILLFLGGIMLSGLALIALIPYGLYRLINWMFTPATVVVTEQPRRTRRARQAVGWQGPHGGQAIGPTVMCYHCMATIPLGAPVCPYCNRTQVGYSDHDTLGKLPS